MFRPKQNPHQEKRAVPDWLGGSGFWDSSAITRNENDNDHLREGQFEFREELVPIKWHDSDLRKERKVLEYDEEEESFKAQTDENVRKERAAMEAAPPVPISMAEEAKLSDLEFELSREVICLDVLQRIAKSGIPDGGRLRSTTWKILLGYLPVERDLWEVELAENRAKYAALKDELLLRPSELTRRLGEESNSGHEDMESYTDGPLRRLEISDGDHPLNVGKASVWNKYFQKIADIYWDLYSGNTLDRDLPGHLLRYPVGVTNNGDVTQLPGSEFFPDTKSCILCAKSDYMPPIFTT